MAWRDYWQLIWIEKGEAINSDLKREQPDTQNREIPRAIINSNTGIDAIDIAIKNLYKTGYVHNHLRMYIACMVCNIGKSYWKAPAQWMYYHLLDGDWASNALSWQWVSGANANKKYYANQQNINKYCFTTQKNTFMDVEYEDFDTMNIPKELAQITCLTLQTPLPPQKNIILDSDKPTLIYNFYNLDPTWHLGEDANRVLLLEPSIFKQYPISQKSVDFMLALSKNMDKIQIFVGEFDDLIKTYTPKNIFYKEHPLNHYVGTEEPRDWMFSTTGYYRSFFAFWKKCKKELKRY